MATRRHIRLRKEYLYRKSLEGKEKEEYEKKERIRRALAEGRAVPTDLRDFAAAVKDEMDAEDESTRHQRLAVDDEYAHAGTMDPKVCVTTSHDPSSRLKQFAKEVRYIFPNAQTINRGSTTVKELVDTCRDAGVTDLLLVQETRGEPDALIVCHLPYGPTAYFTLSSVVMRHDIADRGTVSGAYPHLVLDGFSTPIGKRVATILQHLFPVPKEESKRIITFANRDDTVSFRHHVYTKDRRASSSSSSSAAEGGGAATSSSSSSSADSTGTESIVLTEVGPRMEMTPFQIKLGTLDQTEAETEWVLRPYMRTAAKRKAL